VNLCHFSFRSSLIILSLSHTLGCLEFSWNTLGGCGILGSLEKEGKGRVGKHKRALASIAISDFLQVPSYMYDLFSSFGMHDTCIWFLGYDLSLAWRMAGIDSGLSSLAISWIAMVILGLLSFL